MRSAYFYISGSMLALGIVMNLSRWEQIAKYGEYMVDRRLIRMTVENRALCVYVDMPKA